ncbi:TIGR04282 family arsenosugar biosynthesis glycosyltransferase [Mycolicibacterium flavescens]|uniref:Glycosyltransferase involved in cell wall biogenesis n=1 Tax=Mycolicibacterium flavescens TaxID=1776 RepID=A0A1E3RD34_MYCFV|nr:DUF2064 domain-containing protein [Mycolicibacterium flavescens]ODQ87754.1 glycosyltransferase involved in cell wall biogenesis [Mycolicibacterium flavescens]
MIAVTALVVAKAPVPGLAKTRLAVSVGERAAADIAAAALLDTLDAVAAAPVQHRVVALTGDLNRACRADELRERLTAFTVVAQRGDDFAARLAHAHADAFTGIPVLQIGMDTPQVGAELLAGCARTLMDADAVLGLAADGGWWILGVARPELADCLRGVPMSRSDTGALTRKALQDNGATVLPLPELADVDTIGDIAAVRRMCAPDSRFARATETVRT